MGDQSVNERAARVATSPPLLGASHARRNLPAPAFAVTTVAVLAQDTTTSAGTVAALQGTPSRVPQQRRRWR